MTKSPEKGLLPASGKFSLSIGERLAAGRALRARAPRSSHGSWAPGPARPDPIDLIESTNQGRWPEMVPVRWGRMVTSPFAFLRGAAIVMAADLAGSPNIGIEVQASGDAHLLNFGVFASRERNLVFGLNDFDETLPGPWEWDVKRLAASCVSAGRFIGASEADARDVARWAARAYHQHISEFAHMGALDIWYRHLDGATVLPTLSRAARQRAEEILSKASRRTHVQVLQKMSMLVDHHRRFIEDPPLVVRMAQDDYIGRLDTVVQEWLTAYRSSLTSDRRDLIDRYRIIDVARKVVGVGSVGTHCYVVLLHGYRIKDPLFLQVKEALPSVLEPYLRGTRIRHNGQRVVDGQRYIQPTPDIFLGWGTGTTVHGTPVEFYIRQLRDMKGGAVLAEGVTGASNLMEYAGVCGWALALAHARSGDPGFISGYLGPSERFDDAIVRWAVSYADQTERDHEYLTKAIKRGRVAVEHGL